MGARDGARAAAGGPRRRAAALVPWRDLCVWGSLVLLLLAGAALSDAFLTAGNLLNILRQTSIIAIIAVGMTFVIASGGIDLSVGSIVALVSVLVVGTMNRYGIAAAVAAGLAVGAVAGLANGAGIVWLRMPPFIATLAGMTIYRGLARIYSDGRPISARLEVSDRFNNIAASNLGGVPLPVLYMAVAFVAGYLLLRYTRFGVYTLAIGGNEDAARLSGVAISRTKLLVYTLSGLCSAVAAIIEASRVTSGAPYAGQAYELEAIAAVVIGGTSLSGGKGGVWGTLAGALVLYVLLNLFNILNVSPYYQEVFKGVVIVLAVLLQYRRKT